jgi:hypothetical protein
MNMEDYKFKGLLHITCLPIYVVSIIYLELYYKVMLLCYVKI